MADLSILIPSRNEMFLAKTIENILQNIEGDTEVIAVMDGVWADPPVPQHPRLTVIHVPESIGQRAATNQAARLSNAKYVMKCDAHCAFDKGFDVKMMTEMHDDWTMVPTMKNLHAFDWVCADGHRRYQGPSGPCQVCSKPTTRDILWQPKPSPNSVSYCFDSTPHFQYFGEFSKRPEGQGEVTPSMSLQGSCWMLTREKYWELGICDEGFGSWGSQGIEVAVKTWLSGGSVMVNKKTWYAHMFRTQGGDFSFPYPISGRDQEKAKSYAKDLFFKNKWPKQVRPLSWLIEKFWPVTGWSEQDLDSLKKNTFHFSANDIKRDNIPSMKTDEVEPVAEPTKGIVYYTNHQLNIKTAQYLQKNLTQIGKLRDIPIVSVSLKKMSFGDKNIRFPHLKNDYASMYKQIFGGLENSTADIIFICFYNVLYNFQYFNFTPPKKDIFYFNSNIKKVKTKEIYALCGYRETLLNYFEKLMNKPVKNFKTPPAKTKTWKSESPIEVLEQI